jgi:phospholipase A-2-activating protein
VQAQAIPATEIPGQVGGVDVASLPDESALEAPGSKEGQYKIVRAAQGGEPTLYTWAQADGRWNKVGTVVGGPAGGAAGPSLGAREHKGKLYDFVFDGKSERASERESV